MVSTGKDFDCVFLNFIDKPMLIINPARPATRKVVLQGFRFSYSLEGRALNLCDEFENAKSCPAIFLNPPSEIFKCGGVKFQAFHVLPQAVYRDFDFSP